MKPYNLLLKYPTRSRPQQFKQTLSKWVELAERPKRLHWLVSIDSDDTTMQSESIKDFCKTHGVEVHKGNSRNKIEAINRDIDKTDYEWDVVVVVSDDFEPTRKGWDTAIDKELPHTDAALWWNDGRHRRICTLPMIGRKAYKATLNGVIYDPDFATVYCDNWQTDLLQKAGKLKFVDDVLFVHKWERDRDELGKRNDNMQAWARDEKIYRARGGVVIWDG